MRSFAIRASALGALLSVQLLALPASADPILNLSTTSIALSPTQTVITFSVIPNGMLVAGISLTLSAAASEVLIVDIQSLDAAIIADPPIGNSASFSGVWFPDRDMPFDVGTLTVAGITPGTSLMASGSYVISDGAVPIPNLTDLDFVPNPMVVATVVSTPEPTSAALLALGLFALAGRRRSNG